MRRMVLFLALALTLAVGIAMGVIGTQMLGAQQEPVKRTPLLKTDLAGMEGKEAVVALVELAAEAAVGKHHHPGHEFAYILSGTGSWELEGKEPVAMKTGDIRYLTPRQVHNVKNTGNAPLKVLAFGIYEKGQPPVTPVK